MGVMWYVCLSHVASGLFWALCCVCLGHAASGLFWALRYVCFGHVASGLFGGPLVRLLRPCCVRPVWGPVARLVWSILRQDGVGHCGTFAVGMLREIGFGLRGLGSVAGLPNDRAARGGIAQRHGEGRRAGQMESTHVRHRRAGEGGTEKHAARTRRGPSIKGGLI